MGQSPPRSALLVEDDPFFWTILRRFLSPWQLEIVTVSSAESAKTLVRERSFDLYLIDLQLSDDDAIDLLTGLQVRSDETSSRCVVVTSFPVIGSGFTNVPVVDKTQLASLGPHLLRILGRPVPPESRSSAVSAG